jgi:4-carboxymuconolactone decarboxylase
MATTTTRVAPLRDDEMNAEQRSVAAEIAGARGGVLGGPFAIWIRDPELAKRINHLSARLRKNSGFEKRLVELLVITITRQWRANYAWTAHARQALEEGIAPEVVDAIRTGAPPPFVRADEQLIYDIVSELIETLALGDATYARGVNALGIDLMIELVTTVGLYTMISMTLAVFDVPPANGEAVL